jgi:hypothetical protein
MSCEAGAAAIRPFVDFFEERHNSIRHQIDQIRSHLHSHSRVRMVKECGQCCPPRMDII